MSRTLQHIERGPMDFHVVKIYKDSDLGEYVGRLYIQGKLYEPADYFTDNKSDAIGTAKHMVKTPVARRNPVSKRGEKLTVSVKWLNHYADSLERDAKNNLEAWILTGQSDKYSEMMRRARDVRNATTMSVKDRREYLEQNKLEPHHYLQRTNPVSKRVKTHLLHDIDEAARGIEQDLKLIKSRKTNPAKHRAISGVHRVEWSTNGREWHAVHGLRNLNKTTAVAAAKQLHKHAPHMHVKVVP